MKIDIPNQQPQISKHCPFLSLGETVYKFGEMRKAIELAPKQKTLDKAIKRWISIGRNKEFGGMT